MRQVTCNERLRRPYQHYKCTGAPWVSRFDDNVDRVYNKCKDGDAYEGVHFESQEHVELIRSRANAK